MNADIINIKGTRQGLVICLDATHDFEELKRSLISKIESAQGFFKGAKFSFHLGSSLTAEKTRELQEICCQHGLIPDTSITWPTRDSQGPTAKPSIAASGGREKGITGSVQSLMHEASPSLPSTGITEVDKKPCLLVKRGLRSGQNINFNGSVTVLGDVNPGSQITAGGDIIVMGSLRGVVHAGAQGDDSSIIMAYRLNPIQLRISSVISRPPENNPASSVPEIARLYKGQMVIEPYLTHGLKK